MLTVSPTFRLAFSLVLREVFLSCSPFLRILRHPDVYSPVETVLHAS